MSSRGWKRARQDYAHSTEYRFTCLSSMEMASGEWWVLQATV